MTPKLTKATIYTNLDQITLVLTASYEMAKRYEYWAENPNNDEATEWIDKATSLRTFCLQLELIRLEIAEITHKEGK